MGLSFHYSGEISDKNRLPELIEEVKTIARTHEWEYHVFETRFPEQPRSDANYADDLYGISFNPPACEMVDICFLEDGKMSSLFTQQLWGDSETPEERKYLYMISVKTMFAGREIHASIIDIFRYISKKYLNNFKLNDEGEYWETNDKEVLQKQFDHYNAILDTFELAYDSIPPDGNEDLISYIERIAEKTDNHLKRKNKS